jgi:hypothetical protein
VCIIKRKQRNCKMSISLGTKGKLHFISSIALLLIITLAIEHCNCDQGKDPFLDVIQKTSNFSSLRSSLSLPAPSIHPFMYSCTSALLFSIVDCCCWMQFFFVVVKFSVCGLFLTKSKKKENQEEDNF